MRKATEFGRLVAEARDFLGLTQREVADELGVTGAAIGLVENGHVKTLARRHHARLARVLGISPKHVSEAYDAARRGETWV